MHARETIQDLRITVRCVVRNDKKIITRIGTSTAHGVQTNLVAQRPDPDSRPGETAVSRIRVEISWIHDLCTSLFSSLCAELRLIKCLSRGSLIRPDTARFDIGHEVILSPDRMPGHSAEHRQLPHMCQRISDGTLQEPFDRTGDG